MDRRRFIKAGIAGAVAAPLIGKYTGAQAQAQVTLKLHHFLPPVANGHAHMLAPWAKKIETDSNGRIKIDIYPSISSAARRRSSTTRRATASPTSSGPCPARPPAASRRPR